MKAWTVSDSYGDKSVVVFHNHGLAARRLGANELDEDFDSVDCKRSKEFDEYAGQGFVPPIVRLKAGWWFECRTCYRRVMFDDNELEDSEITEAGKDSVYCSIKCRKD